MKINWKKIFNKSHEIVDKTTKTGRAIIILKSKNKQYQKNLKSRQDSYKNRKIGYFK